ncbi:uncharacterized protein LOC126843285 isoform X2 [Adelges cooleyi]|uniref:uncharacterized protein LOC126843285 isoform X2 n=1 Tax=Adelges cooleyi TaxID=133065 RepID=UPI00217F5AEE|nr:uncharacterized protein LOC126843285 isoform X2 [Adelges cooleyi]
MSMKYFVLLSCLAYYATSIETDREDDNIPIVHSEDSTAIAEQVKQDQDQLDAKLREDQFESLLKSWRAIKVGQKIPKEQILSFFGTIKVDSKGHNEVAEFLNILDERGLGEDGMEVVDFNACVLEFMKKMNWYDEFIQEEQQSMCQRRGCHNYGCDKESIHAENPSMCQCSECHYYSSTVLSDNTITALSNAVGKIKVTDMNNGKMTLEELLQILDETQVDSDLEAFCTYLLAKVSADGIEPIISPGEFRKMMDEFNELEKHKIMFKSVDSNGDGKVTVDEVHTYLRSLGGIWDTKNAVKMLESADIDGNKVIDLNEFIKMIHNANICLNCTNEFHEMDLNQDNTLSKDELQDGMDKKFNKVCETQVGKVFDILDGNHDGKITENEFIVSRGI